ncbi:MAG: VOC family protein [Rubrivivax sp.]|jgi:catechol 2,3-dioxygenase-like lactoylglutathione lyase family enzyme|nr:VOC family protein [Rubrivivax sp.]
MSAPDHARRLAYTTLLVPDYDEAIAHYREALGFEVVEDTRLTPSKRWVVIRQPQGGNALLLAQPGNEEQRALIGRQAGGRVWLFLHTADLDADLAHLARQTGIRLTETPRQEAYGRVVVFEDRYGNRWDLIEPEAGLAP